MNKCEKIMAERMTFTTRRGRTAEGQRRAWLQRIRRERQADSEPFDVQIGAFWHKSCRTYRQAKIAAIGILCELNKGTRDGQWDGLIRDKATQIILWESK